MADFVSLGCSVWTTQSHDRCYMPCCKIHKTLRRYMDTGRFILIWLTYFCLVASGGMQAHKLVSIQLWLVFPLPCFPSSTSNLLSTYLFQISFPGDLLFLFLRGLVLSTVVLVWQCWRHFFPACVQACSLFLLSQSASFTQLQKQCYLVVHVAQSNVQFSRTNLFN